MPFDPSTAKPLSQAKSFDPSTARPADQPESAGPIGAVMKGLATSVAELIGTPSDIGNMILGGAAAGGQAEAQLAEGKPISSKAVLEQPPMFNTHIPGGSEDIKTYAQGKTEKAGLGKSALVYKDLKELPPEDRPFAIAGEAYSLAITPEFALSKLGKLEKLGKLAETAPKTVKTLEKAAAGGAAIGGAITATSTDDPKKIAAGEIVGSLVSPLALATRFAASTGGEVGSGLRAMFGGSKEYKASQYLQKALKEAGEDPDKIAAALKQHIESGHTLTSGQASGSKVLLSLEKDFANKNARFGETASKNAQETMASLRNAVTTLEATNNPDMLRAAAKLRKRYFDTLLNDQVTGAKEDLLKAVTKLSPEGKEVAGDVSEKAFRVLDLSLKKARKAESALYAEVPQTAKAEVSNTLQAARDAKAKYLTDVSEVPPGLGDFLERHTPDNRGTVSWLWKNPKKTSGELLKLRSQSLSMMREAQASGDWKHAAVYREIAEGAIKDLNAIPGIQKPLTTARQFSNSLHDTFTRTFAGDALARDATGARSIEPETLLRRTLGGGKERANLRFDQLLGAAEFGDRRLAQAMSSIQERYLRQNARSIVDPGTGKVSAAGLVNFQRDNAALLEQFPNLKADFKNVATAQKALDDAEALKDKATKAMGQKALFGTIAGAEDPVYAVGKILGGENPISNYAQVARMARKSGPEAMAGLRAATTEHAYNQAFDANGDFSWARFRQNLTAPVAKGKESPLDLMVKNGLIDGKMTDHLMTIIQRGDSLEQAMRFGGMNIDAPAQDMLYDFLIATVGSKVGKEVTKPFGGTTLVAQSAATKAARTMFEKMPNARVMDFIMQASEEPKIMADLLTRPTSARQAKGLMESISSFLDKGGYIPRGPFVAAGYEMADHPGQGQEQGQAQ